MAAATMNPPVTLFYPHETLRRVSEHWCETRDGDKQALALYERHYSCYQYKDKRIRKIFCGPGEKTVLISPQGDALFVWRKFIDDSGQQGINNAVFRNEGPGLSSEMIREAMELAWERWPGERLYTYVNAAAVKSANPGYCFKKAGWKRCGVTKCAKLLIFEALPPDTNTAKIYFSSTS